MVLVLPADDYAWRVMPVYGLKDASYFKDQIPTEAPKLARISTIKCGRPTWTSEAYSRLKEGDLFRNGRCKELSSSSAEPQPGYPKSPPIIALVLHPDRLRTAAANPKRKGQKLHERIQTQQSLFPCLGSRCLRPLNI